jgi:adenylate cyclase
MSGQGQEAIPSLRRAIELNPSLASAYFGLGHAHLVSDPDEAIRMFERAIRLSPRDPVLGSFHAYLGHAHLQAGRWAEAREHALICIRLQPKHPLGHRLRASSCGYLGKREEALAAMAENQRLVPGFNEARYRRLTYPAMAEREIEGWKKAGWEESAIRATRSS